MFSVSIETWGEGVDSVKDESLFELTDALSVLGAVGVVTSSGGIAGGPGATFSLEVGADAPASPGEFGDISFRAARLFEDACLKVGVEHGGIARLEVSDEIYIERDLDREPEQFVGVSELSETLGVSRQRVSELRARQDFPVPIAELRAGPVWKMSNLQRFIASWPRKPGRPRRRAAT